MRKALILAALAAAPTPSAAETRCGWIHNPTPGNWWLTDAHGDWVLMTQGSEGVPGMDLIPDLTAGDWVRTNGWYGYGCACLEVETAGGAVRAILGVDQIPLSRCESDPALPPAF